MHVRRPLMAVTGLALTALLAGCAGDDLASDNEEPTSGSGGGGGEGTSVVIGSQSFDEAALVTAMYQQVLEAEGYTVETRLVDTRPIYLNEMPDSVQIAPEYVAGIVDQLNTDANGPDAKPLSTSDAQETIDAGASLLEDDKGIQPAQNLIPAVSTEFLADHPDIEGPLNDLMAALDNDTLGQLLVSVQIDREQPADVAKEFLESEGLL